MEKTALYFALFAVLIGIAMANDAPCPILDCPANATCTNGTCVCNAGYEQDEHNCTNIDECQRGMHNCHPNASCIDISGSFTCLCTVGLVGDGVNCTIAVGTSFCGTCSPYAYCNTTCICYPGFSGNGSVCEDIDECTVDGNPCGPNGTCANLMGNYSCTCDRDFQVVRNREGFATCELRVYRFPASEIASDPGCNPENSRGTRNGISEEVRQVIRFYQAMQNNSTSDSSKP